MQVYIVGGAVRDTLLGHEPKDRDYVVVGSSTDEMLAAGYRKVGSDFPVFLHPTTQEEYALARTERKTGRGYAGFAFSTEEVTLEEDLSRRDLTINSMAMTPEGELVDPFNGARDLAEKTIRHTTLAFCEDPLRILRVARFLARFGPQWQIAPETEELIHKMVAAGEADFLVPERVWAELEKGLMERYPVLMFDILRRFGLVNRPPFVEYNKAQACYFNELQAAAAKATPVEVRFSLACSRVWTGEEAKASRIPSAVREVCAGVCTLSEVLESAGEATPELLLKLLRAVDALRQKDRFKLIAQALDYLHPQWASRLRDAQQKVLSVKPEDVIPPGAAGPEIQKHIHAARLLALAA